MFNLGYMHELGHGMPKDIHLAKRFYDMAAETSTDAKVPVAMALAKLGLNFAINNWPYTLTSFKVTISPETWAKLELYWDIYLLTLLVGLLGVVLIVRRPRNNRQQRENNVERGPATQDPSAEVAVPQAEVAPEVVHSSNTETAAEHLSNDNSEVNSGNADSVKSEKPQEEKPS